LAYTHVQYSADRYTWVQPRIFFRNLEVLGFYFNLACKLGLTLALTH
jgi:hypothetical protein